MSQVNKAKRRFLLIATSIWGGIGFAGTATPFVASMLPSERAKAAGAPVESDIAGLAPGSMRIIEWRGAPVWILHRTEAMLAELHADHALLSDPDSDVPQQPDYARNEFRSINPAIAVLVGVCTHLGCSPEFRPAEDKAAMGQTWRGGFYCPCHGSRFDLAGRVLRGSPAPTNLLVPPYEFVSENKIVIGADRRKG